MFNKNLVGLVLAGIFIISCCSSKYKNSNKVAEAVVAAAAQEPVEQVVQEPVEQVVQEQEPVQQEEPKQEEKPKYENGDIIVLQFSAEWCGPCHALKNEIKNDARLQQYFKEDTKGYFVIDIEAADENSQKWTSIAKPSSLPTVCVYSYQDGKWKEEGRFTGLRQTSFMLGWITKIKENMGK